MPLNQSIAYPLLSDLKAILHPLKKLPPVHITHIPDAVLLLQEEEHNANALPGRMGIAGSMEDKYKIR